MNAVSAAQIRAIHALKGRAGLDDEAYRALLMREARVSSSKALSRDAAIGIIDRLKALSGQPPRCAGTPRRRPGALVLSGPYAGICRALWISGWQLGVFDHREDTALVAFVKRQTQIDHLNWVRDWGDARKVIEALKAWLSREAGVVWPARRDGDPRLMKRAVVEAQLRLLGETRPVPDDGDLDGLMADLGRRVRALGARRGRP